MSNNTFTIKEFTICLHCGCCPEIVNNQIKNLKFLEKKYKVYWNNRIDRFPFAYDSYSELINESIATSPTEFVILINDRTIPTVEEVEKILYHLENGFACSFMYNVGFMGFSKELVRKIGWWDQRYLGGGWEDVEWVYRLKMNNLALYESCDSNYEHHWKSPLQANDRCARSTPFFSSKWIHHEDRIEQVLEDEKYDKWDSKIGEKKETISKTWNDWNSSVLNKNYDGPNKGLSPSTQINNRKIYKNLK